MSASGQIVVLHNDKSAEEIMRCSEGTFLRKIIRSCSRELECRSGQLISSTGKADHSTTVTVGIYTFKPSSECNTVLSGAALSPANQPCTTGRARQLLAACLRGAASPTFSLPLAFVRARVAVVAARCLATHQGVLLCRPLRSARRHRDWSQAIQARKWGATACPPQVNERRLPAERGRPACQGAGLPAA